jgi:uncharacterized protein YyaL (SSP411 family)
LADLDLDRLTGDVLRALANGAAASPAALSFLLARYVAAGRADVRDALEPALATALDRPFASLAAGDRAAWLRAFVDAVPVAQNDRVLAAVDALVACLRADWIQTTCVGTAAAILDACLISADVRDPRAIVPDAIDQLERVVGAAYHPGDRLAHDWRAPARRDGDLADHVQCAALLLTAYHATARLPYAMLAEELVQRARRTWWDDKAGALTDATAGEPHRFEVNCAAARVWCQLARLHADEEYRRAAVLAPDADYRREASRILMSPAVESAASGMASAVYGLAVTEYLAS